MLIQLLFVLTAIIIGARLGGIGLGVMGGVGLAILTFVFGLQPTSPPIDVMLMIAAVISAASCMQAAGGLDYMVKIAERILRRNPSHVTILAPIVTYTLTFLAGTGHVAYSVLPVIAEVAADSKIRPERPLGISVIASQQGITASPISAATVALLGLLAGFDISLFDILKICVPATLIGVLVGALFSMRVGKELIDDPEYQRRVREGIFKEEQQGATIVKNLFNARISVALFLCATLRFYSDDAPHFRWLDCWDANNNRDTYAQCSSTYTTVHPHRWYCRHQRQHLPRRDAGCYCHLWNSLDG